MRVRRLHLDRYGVFENRSVALGPALTLVLGDNETGKSTTLDALADLLWSIPARSTRAFRHGRPILALHADLCLPDGIELTVTRRASGLVDAGTGLLVPESWRGPGDSREQWLRSYGLSHAELRKGGKSLFDGDGDLAELVFRARSGQDVGHVLDELTRRCDELYKSHGNAKNKIVRKTLQDFVVASEQVTERMVAADRVQEALQEMKELKGLCALAKTAVDEARGEFDLVQTKQSVMPSIRELVGTTRRVAEVRAEGPCLSESELAEHAELAARIKQAESVKSGYDRDNDTKRVQLAEVSVDEALRSDRGTVGRLNREVEGALHGRATAEESEVEAERLDTEARNTLASIIVVEPEHLTADLIGQVWIGADRAAELSAMASGLSEARAEVRRRKTALETEETVFDGLGTTETTDPQAVAAVREAVRAATREDSAHQSHRRAQDELLVATRRKAAKLAELGLPPSTRIAALPDATRVSGLRDDITRLRNRVHAAEGRVVEADTELVDTEKALQGIEQREIADHDSLAVARHERDDLVATAISSWLGGQPVAAAPHLPTRLERAVAHADDLADRLAEDLAAAAERRALLDQLGRVSGEAEEARELLGGLEEELARCELDWNQLWSPTSLSAPQPAEAALRLKQLNDVLAAEGDLTAAAAAVQLWWPEVERQRDTLAARLAEAGRDRRGADLPSLLVTAEELIAEDDAAREQRVRATDQANRRENAAADLHKAQGHQNELAAAWLDRTTAVGLADLRPDGWTHRIGVVDRARELHGEAEAAAEAGRRGRSRYEQFAADLSELAARHHIVAAEPAEGCDELARRLRTADTAAAEASALAKQVDELEAKRAKVDTALGLDRAALADLVERLGVEDVDAAVLRSRDLVRLTELLRDHTDKVRSALPAIEVASLVAELSEVEDEVLQEQVDDAEERLVVAEECQKQNLEKFGAVKQQHKELVSRPAVAELQFAAEEQAALLDQQVEEYLTVLIQRELLDGELRAYEAKHASPLLDEAGRLLERLTEGRYVALQAHSSGGEQSLRIIDVEDTARRTGEMSEGTADQVFLALRLAGIGALQAERRTRGLPVLPVVLDDVLMAFDDTRARVALEVMADLAEEWQIIVLSHHTHLSHLAAELDHDHISVTQLGPAPPMSEVNGEDVRRKARQVVTRTATMTSPTAQLRDTGLIRAWARQNGHSVSERGRISTEVKKAYEAAHR
ncbi:histone-like nucleoid-structuring protein Lsr2 [Actinokineospora sp. NBRC 105648]|uniref:AAA family ATPase n=1 Tax=Actinokineospora sp. NBRC 105648 TaxID=3032206 RepID=UPI00249FB3AD|nr:histone-like nucleoid-structuring protein Lsr2 [Actinokineospora sp. NBRC 105648]GLZ42817.1 hypothetical protein Acsp05_64410 [Actinokineospora sp. NBRC 105648]